nr:unnamed protein product [Haemonchus contortus]
MVLGRARFEARHAHCGRGSAKLMVIAKGNQGNCFDAVAECVSATICEYSDDFGCRNTNLAFDMNDHSSYFDIDVETFIAGKCDRTQLF